MQHRRSLPLKSANSPKNNTSLGAENEGRDLSSYLSYALLILYVLASVSSTKDEMLLIPTNGIQLPLVSVNVSIVGFYALSPLIVLIGHLIALRKIPQTFSRLPTALPELEYERLSVTSDYIMLFSLLFAGPLTLLLITYKFAAYQSPALFLLHAVTLLYAWHAAAVRYRQALLGARKMPWPIGVISFTTSTMLWIWIIVAADVIFLPSQYSATLWLKMHTRFLNNGDGGTVSWVPHIKVDRGTRLWSGAAKEADDFAAYSGHTDVRELFMTRGIALDIRSRNLRFLDMYGQVIPRIWAHDADLSGANLSFTRLYGSQFIGTNLDGATFELASLDGSAFMNMTLNNVLFSNTHLRGSYWDRVTINDSVLDFSDLSLSSLSAVSLNRVRINGSNFTAASLFEVTADQVLIGSEESYMILDATRSDQLMADLSPFFVVAAEASLIEVSKKLCMPKPDVGWEYAWNYFNQVKRVLSATQPRVVLALQSLFKLKQCKNLRDHGLRKSQKETAALKKYLN
ncbi:pentapeptide repeat-containing protein [Pseudomonas moraviensis]|uniref:pentapeptide repeat-containing protein n=1 Tax=Pseudomonas moraviensis TaxID=321662 RepID=UPI002B2ECB24|nr:pentapeptide repeat-containing protein [Pseudomonas moraviensis]